MKIGFLIANRANWARCKTVIKSLAKSPDVAVVVFACSGFVLSSIVVTLGTAKPSGVVYNLWPSTLLRFKLP